MKLIILFVLLMAAQSDAGWFDKAEDRLRAEEHQLRIQTERQLTLQRQSTERWQIFSGILGVTCVVLLVVGAAIGAKTRREATRGQ